MAFFELLLALSLPACALAPCPDAPHCVSSQESRPARAVAPLRFDGDEAKARERLKSVLTAMGIAVVEERSDSLRAVATSRVFRFQDDVDFAFAPGVIHVRSCSRTGRYDFGVNRRRVETIRRLLGH